LPVAISVTLPASFEITKYVNSGHLKTKLSKETNVKKSFNLRWDHGDIDLYYQTTCHMLYPIYNGLTEYYNNFVNVDDVINIHNDNFDMSQLHAIIETCYNQTVCALKSAATSSIRKATSSSFNAWWNSDLSKAEMHSLESHKARVAAGKPRDGELFLLRNKYKLYYKLEIKKARNASEKIVSDQLHEALVNKKPVNFWKTWKNKISKTNGNRNKIEGNLSNHEEVKQFAPFFSE